MAQTKLSEEPTISIRLPEDLRRDLERVHARDLERTRTEYGWDVSLSATVRRLLRVGLDRDPLP